MLKLKRGWLIWSESDVVAMSRILSEHATKRKAPWNPALVRAALRKGLLASEKVLKVQAQADTLMSFVKVFKRLPDLEPHPVWQERWFAHQRVDVEFMRQMQLPAYLLAHDVGVGKTLESIGFAMQHDVRRILVVSTNSAKEQWVDEIHRWDIRGPRTQVVQGSVPLQIQQLQSKSLQGEPVWVIAHWESLVHARVGHLAHPWDLVILDEAHHIRNRDAQRTHTALGIESRYRLALTAHPYSSSVDELFPILQFLYPDRYSSFWRFVAMHIEVTPKPFGGLDLGEPKRPKLLKWELAPFMLRRTKHSVRKNLPALTRVFRTTTLTPKGEKEYARLKKEFFVELEGRENALAIPSVLARITRLRQYLVDPALVGGTTASVKFPLVLELLEGMAHPPVIFTEFREAALHLQQFLRKHQRKAGIIQGRRHMAGRSARAVGKEFLAGQYDALIVVRKAGSESLNLGGFGEGMHLDPPWGPRGLEQSEGRVDRPEEGTGRIVPATFYPLIVKGSYEEKMWRRVKERGYDFKKVFTVDSIKELFS